MNRIQLQDVALNVMDRGTGRIVLLVHGFPLDHSMWVGQMDAFAKTHRVIAPDLRGFGNSTLTPGTTPMWRFADDLAELLAAMQITEPVTFCGLSMGGYIAFQFFKRHRNQLNKLILCDTRAAADTPEAAVNRLKQAEQVLREGASIAADAMLPRLFPANIRETNPAIYESTRQVILKTAPATIAAAQCGMAERPDLRGELAQIDLPTLVVCGELDVISPPEEMQGIAAAIPGSQFEVIAGAGHMSPLESPDKFNAVVERFLKRTF